MVLFQSICFGFLYDLTQVLNHQNDTEMYLDPLENPDSYVWFYIKLLCVVGSIMFVFSFLTMHTRKYPRNRCCVRIRGMEEQLNEWDDLQAELVEEEIARIAESGKGKYDDVILHVDRLQCIKFLMDAYVDTKNVRVHLE